MIFPEVNAQLRTDVAFDEMRDVNHHKGPSPLQQLSVGMVTQFPLDYMHLVCLGVTRRILMYWLKSPVRKGIRLGLRTITQISESLETFRNYIPREFSRKCRGLSEIERWKATEFRQFLLFSGIVALKGRISTVVYNHFLLFFVAIHCLVSQELWHSHADYAHDLLSLFITQAVDIYGRDFLVYNVHGLIHLAADVKRFGPLDSFSAFPFENYLGHLKQFVRKPQFPLQQVVRRLSERTQQGIFTTRSTKKCFPDSVPQKEHALGPVPATVGNCIQFKEIYFNGCFYSSILNGDNCVIVNNLFYLIRNILAVDNCREPVLVLERFSRTSAFFGYPLSSSQLGIVKASGLSGHLQTARISEVQRKCVLLPYKRKYVLLPLSSKQF